ncbi:Homocysteine S-methyltransferase [Lecanosticta acicola]|uniref:Homocysteine S-methyltransferase n=1 Tax=Lecanosticta acicola TaxID=111012 RepID=A0AAI9EA47_9PEZI|nr:Homocysteine S-methyltransferase [Lecanosticta acicola]
MIGKEDFDKLLQARGTLVIDGALATELEARGSDLNHALWSAKILKDDPASIEKVHLDYYLAGGDIAITASYQAAPAGLREHFGMDESAARDMISASVDLASQARQTAYEQGLQRRMLVAGSVGPYGAYLADGSEYRGDYIRTYKELKDFHRPRIQALVDAGVDLLALETIPNVNEIEALLELLKEEFPDAVAWLSCTVGSPESLSDGTPWSDVLHLVNGHADRIVGFGINCIAMSIATDTLKNIVTLTPIPLVCYPNSGETWDATTKTWQSLQSGDVLYSDSKGTPGLAEELDRWTGAGAKLIGGCCRTGPEYIKAVSHHLTETQNHKR